MTKHPIPKSIAPFARTVGEQKRDRSSKAYRRPAALKHVPAYPCSERTSNHEAEPEVCPEVTTG